MLLSKDWLGSKQLHSYKEHKVAADRCSEYAWSCPWVWYGSKKVQVFSGAETWPRPDSQWPPNSSFVCLNCDSVQFSCSVVSDSLRPHESQHARPPYLSPTPGVYSNSCPSSWWYHPAISSSVVPFSACPHPSQHQGLFQWVNSSHEVAKLLHYNFSLSFFFHLFLLVGG